MNLRKIHFLPPGIVALLLGGILRILSLIFVWPVGLVIASEILLLIAVAWIAMFDIFPLFLAPFIFIRDHFPRRYSFFLALIALFAIFQGLTYFLPSGNTKDSVTTLAFLSFVSAIVWIISVQFIASFRPLLRRMKRPPKEIGNITFGDIVTSVAIILTPTIALSFFFSPPGLDSNQVTPNTVFLTSLLTDAAIAAYLYLFVIHPKIFTWKQLGLRNVDREDLGRAFVLFLLVAVLIVIARYLLQRLGVPLEHYSFTSKQNAYFAIGVSVLVTPFVEELYFRGFLFKGLSFHHPLWVSYLSSALLFALLHPPVIAMVEVFIVGLVLAYVVQQTKSIWPAVAIHMLNNAFVFGVLLLTFK